MLTGLWRKPLRILCGEAKRQDEGNEMPLGQALAASQLLYAAKCIQRQLQLLNRLRPGIGAVLGRRYD